MDWSSRNRFCARFGALLVLALPAVSAFAQASPPLPTDPPPNTGPYQAFWAGIALIPTNGEPYQDFAANMTFGDVPVRRDFFVLYQTDGGLYPYAGIQQVESDPDWMRRHFLKLQHTINWSIPDPNQSGYGAIDYEAWSPCWSILANVPSNQGPDARDLDFKDDWRDYIRLHRPELLLGRDAAAQEAVFESTYNEAVQRFFVATINECKRLRPNMKWGFYMFPPRSYYDMLTPQARAAWAAKHRPYLNWLYEASDAIFPDIYALYYTAVGRRPDYSIQEDEPWQFDEYVRWNVTQAVELANGKPVIAFVFIRYHENARHYDNQFLNDYNLQKSFELPRQYGANGVALWEAIDSTRKAREDQDNINQKVVPAIRTYFTDAAGNPLTPPTPSNASPSPDSGSQGSPQIGSISTNPGNQNDPLRTRPYISVRPDPDPPANPSGSGNDNPPPSEQRPMRGTINVPGNVRTNSRGNRNPSWPAIVQRRISTTN